MDHQKIETTTTVGTGFYSTADRVGNSRFLSRGEFQGGLYEVTRTRNIIYTTGGAFNKCTHSVTATANGYKPAAAAEVASIRWSARAERGGDLTDMHPAESVVVALRPEGTVYLDTGVAAVENARMDGYNRLIHLRPDRLENHLRAACELKDTKSSFRQLVTFSEWAYRNLGRKMKIAKGITRPLSVASKLSSVASAYLWYKFGVEPTAQSVASFCRDLSQGKLTVKGSKPKLMQKGQVVKAYYSARPPRSDILQAMYPNSSGSVSINKDIIHEWMGWPTFSGDILPNWVTDPFYCRTVVVRRQTRGCFFAKVKDDFEITGLDELMKKFSWNCPVYRTAWDLLPFSFLVDWFVDVGKFIERLEKRYLQSNYSRHFGTVWRSEQTRTVTYKPAIDSLRMSWDNPVTLAPTKWSYKHSVSGSLGYYSAGSQMAYVREPAGEHTGVASPEWGGPLKAYQISTGMALLAQFGRYVADSLKANPLPPHRRPPFRVR